MHTRTFARSNPAHSLTHAVTLITLKERARPLDEGITQSTPKRARARAHTHHAHADASDGINRTWKSRMNSAL